MLKINITTAELERRQKRIGNMENRIDNDYPVMMCDVDIFRFLHMHGIECQDYMNDPALHLKCQIDFQKHILEDFCTDQYTINVNIDMFVMHTATAFGGNIRYIKGSLPWVEYWVKDDKDLLKLDKIDVPNHGFFQKAKEFRKYAMDNAKNYPVQLADGNVLYPLESLRIPKLDFDGAFSIAQLLMGMDKLSIAVMDRPAFVHRLLEIITNKFADHLQDLVRVFDVDEKEISNIYLADDTATYINPDMCEEFSIPYMKRIRNLFPKAAAGLHLCKTVLEYVKMYTNAIDFYSFLGFKPNAGIRSAFSTFKPVADLFGEKLLLYPDTDPCIVESSGIVDVYEEVKQILYAFEGYPGVCVNFTGWSPEKSWAGMNACLDFAARR